MTSKLTSLVGQGAPPMAHSTTHSIRFLRTFRRISRKLGSGAQFLLPNFGSTVRPDLCSPALVRSQVLGHHQSSQTEKFLSSPNWQAQLV